ncbi:MULTISPECIES: GNAT family N-acetyltransferase [unclassified Amycolatopsis]|uniref:GNAT family N-acetyltransferase n=1 Tax=unclassified Amycolatopsis TaxID=2618356 RepID=UPI0021038089|nr:GNAT family N-acetyltransferase [Amycolatopsis sp. DSM 110486]
MSGAADAEIVLTPLDEQALVRLLDVAVEGADPLEVLPPMDGPPGWTPERREAFLVFHRRNSLDPETATTSAWTIQVGGTIVGGARLHPVHRGKSVEIEAQVWVARWARGRGIGKWVTETLIDAAREGGGGRYVASTTTDNKAAQRLMKSVGANVDLHDGGVDSHLEI